VHLITLSDRTHTHTIGRTSLDEGSACRCDLYLTTRSIRIGPTPMHTVGFEPTIPTSQRPQSHAIDRTAKRFLNGSCRSLMPLRLKPNFPFILSVNFIVILVLVLFACFNFFVFSLFRWFFYVPSVRFSLISLFSSQFPKRHTHTHTHTYI
jgi:hypothetical protein